MMVMGWVGYKPILGRSVTQQSYTVNAAGTDRQRYIVSNYYFTHYGYRKCCYLRHFSDFRRQPATHVVDSLSSARTPSATPTATPRTAVSKISILDGIKTIRS